MTGGDNAAAVMHTGVAGIAAISGILSRPDIGAAAREPRAILDEAEARG
ncbi:MAG: hypothetical protein LBD65_07210 [Spirochaetaceae bacterium]|jgi:thiamine monophosphate synthase|nr:hypothetical protein [Spirochaetaceae bacterium]